MGADPPTVQSGARVRGEGPFAVFLMGPRPVHPSFLSSSSALVPWGWNVASACPVVDGVPSDLLVAIACKPFVGPPGLCFRHSRDVALGGK